MQRYFGKRYGKDIVLSDEDIFHIKKVMRCREHDKIEVVCEENKAYLCEIKSLKPIYIRIIREIEGISELDVNVILAFAPVKNKDHNEFVIQKATELGVSEIILLNTQYTVVKIAEDNNNRFIRYNKIIKEAAEQSKRTRIPLMYRSLNFEDLSKITANLKLIAYEGMRSKKCDFASKVTKLKKGQTVVILIGPEGGFTESEFAMAKELNYKPISLGNRILRMETAAIYTLSVIANALESK